jgi:predicted CoA-substrate-specific enzyme activase
MQETADELIDKLLSRTSLCRSDLAFIVSTGYGRISLAFDDIPFEVVTEISCHAMGGRAVHPTTRTIIDIGGQDSKAIKVDPITGRVIEFVMNDKCAAGTGRFLEKAASLLSLDLRQFGQVALAARTPVQISSQCVVFAESEMVSLRAKAARNNDSDAVANIAAGIHYSAARRVRNLLGRIGNEPDLLFTGGVSNNPGMRRALEDLIGAPFSQTPFDLTFAGALGAAVYASQQASRQTRRSQQSSNMVNSFVASLNEKVAAAESSYIAKADPQKRIGHFCAYTPLEILNAAGVRHARLFKAGGPETVAAGELQTQSVFCDFSKSCIGGFTEGQGAIPLYRAVDKVYNFHTCGSMKRASEMLEQLVPLRLLNLPKIRSDHDSRLFFRDEILNFTKDLEGLIGHEISETAVHDQIALYNRIRRFLVHISELRLKTTAPLSGRDFLDVVKAYYYLPGEELIMLYEDLYRRLASMSGPEDDDSGLRIMISGSIVGDGDRRLLDILEGELGVRVVVEDHCTGLKPFVHRVSEDGDPFLALANGYLDQAPCARMKTLEDNVRFTVDLAQKYRVDGVLYVYLKFCSCYGVQKSAFIDGLQRNGISVLDISSDYSESDHGQLKTRIEAFIEVLNAKKGPADERAIA